MSAFFDLEPTWVQTCKNVIRKGAAVSAIAGCALLVPAGMASADEPVIPTIVENPAPGAPVDGGAVGPSGPVEVVGPQEIPAAPVAPELPPPPSPPAAEAPVAPVSPAPVAAPEPAPAPSPLPVAEAPVPPRAVEAPARPAPVVERPVTPPPAVTAPTEGSGTADGGTTTSTTRDESISTPSRPAPSQEAPRQPDAAGERPRPGSHSEPSTTSSSSSPTTTSGQQSTTPSTSSTSSSATADTHAPPAGPPPGDPEGGTVTVPTKGPTTTSNPPTTTSNPPTTTTAPPTTSVKPPKPGGDITIIDTDITNNTTNNTTNNNVVINNITNVVNQSITNNTTNVNQTNVQVTQVFVQNIVTGERHPILLPPPGQPIVIGRDICGRGGSFALSAGVNAPGFSAGLQLSAGAFEVGQNCQLRPPTRYNKPLYVYAGGRYTEIRDYRIMPGGYVYGNGTWMQGTVQQQPERIVYEPQKYKYSWGSELKTGAPEWSCKCGSDPSEQQLLAATSDINNAASPADRSHLGIALGVSAAALAGIGLLALAKRKSA